MVRLDLLTNLVSLSSVEELIELIIKNEDLVLYSYNPNNIQNSILELASFLLGLKEYRDEYLNRFLYEDKNLLSLTIMLSAFTALLKGKYYINVFATRTSKVLEYILTSLDDSELTHLCQRIGLHIEYSRKCLHEIPMFIDERGSTINVCYHYRIPLRDYLKAAHTLTSETSWKLSSVTIVQGYVYLDTKRKIVRLIVEYIKNALSRTLYTISNSVDQMNEILHRLPTSYRQLIEMLCQELDQKITRSTTYTIVTEDSKDITRTREQEHEAKNSITISIRTEEDVLKLAEETFPPCMKKLLNDLINGENLTHHQRFALAAFLVNIGLDIDLILELFKHSPDFNEKIARYQIEHIAGLRGSKKKYLPFSCMNMKVLGLCTSTECNAKNPLSYYYKALKSKRIKVVINAIS